MSVVKFAGGRKPSSRPPLGRCVLLLVLTYISPVYFRAPFPYSVLG